MSLARPSYSFWVELGHRSCGVSADVRKGGVISVSGCCDLTLQFLATASVVEYPDQVIRGAISVNHWGQGVVRSKMWGAQQAELVKGVWRWSPTNLWEQRRLVPLNDDFNSHTVLF